MASDACNFTAEWQGMHVRGLLFSLHIGYGGEYELVSARYRIHTVFQMYRIPGYSCSRAVVTAF